MQNRNLQFVDFKDSVEKFNPRQFYLMGVKTFKNRSNFIKIAS